MTWTDPRTWVAGEKPSAATLNTHIRDNLKAIGDVWTAYTPTWTALSTNPSIGNGTLTGRYMQAGKLVRGTIRMKAGSTTTFGTGGFIFSLPVAALTTSDECVGDAILTDATGGHYGRVGYLNNSTSLILVGTGGEATSSAVPFTWTTNDIVAVRFAYEAA